MLETNLGKRHVHYRTQNKNQAPGAQAQSLRAATTTAMARNRSQPRLGKNIALRRRGACVRTMKLVWDRSKAAHQWAGPQTIHDWLLMVANGYLISS